MNKATHYDLIIVGGGLVGMSLLLALRHSHLRIALIDERAPQQDDSRLFALNSHSCHLLRYLGLWQSIEEHASAIAQIHISHQGHFGTVHLKDDDHPLGYVIPAKCIEAAFNAALQKIVSETITIYRPASLQTLRQDAEKVSLHLKTAEGEVRLTANYVIGADGVASTVRKEAGIATQMHDYGQCAIVTKTTLSRAHQQIAYERFTADGALAMLPLKENQCATIWTVANEKAALLMAQDESTFLQTLQHEFGYRLGRFHSVDARHVFPLKGVRAKQTVLQRVMLIGNAAHGIHPIAASGFNLALYEVALLAEAIQKPPIDLAAIAQGMQKQQQIVMSISHHLSSLFKQPSRCAAMVLPLGMIGFDRAPFIKKKFIDAMMGRLQAMPHLLVSTNV